MNITIKAARVNKGLTQTEAAKLLHVNIMTLVRWEKGQTEPPYAVKQLMAQIYEWPADHFIFSKAV